MFLNFTEKHFPRSSKLHKIFNKNTVKINYSCTENISQITKGHNKKIVPKETQVTLQCSCRVKTDCIMTMTKLLETNFMTTVLLFQVIYGKWKIEKMKYQLLRGFSYELWQHIPTWKRCFLCVHEKVAIITYPYPDEILNRRSELVFKCRHDNKFLFKNFDRNHWSPY